VAQQYLPDAVVGQHYYDPSEYGREKALVEQWRAMVRREDESATEPPVE
jgi:replication-associated recombination protein RarA